MSRNRIIRSSVMSSRVAVLLSCCALFVEHGAVAGTFSDAVVVTQVRDAANNDVSGASLPAGTVVHDSATVTRSAGTPAEVPGPTGRVDFTLYGNATCDGLTVATDPGEVLRGDGTTSSFDFTTSAAGGEFSYRAHYGGDANYNPADGECEPFTVAVNQVDVSTHVRDASNNDITGGAVPAGSVVHDEAAVTKSAGTLSGVPDPTGAVDFTLYDNGTCDGNVVATDAGEPLSGGGATSTSFTTPASGGAFSYRARYKGDGTYVSHDGRCEAFVAETGRITETNADCEAVSAGTAPALGQITYSVFAGKITLNVNPGAFYFWTRLTTTAPNQVVTVSQSNNSTNNAPAFTVLQAWDRVYTGTCSTWKAGTLIAGGSGASFTIPTPGTHFIAIKYQTKSIAGKAPPVPVDITYNFTTSLGPTTAASVVLKKSQ